MGFQTSERNKSSTFVSGASDRSAKEVYRSSERTEPVTKKTSKNQGRQNHHNSRKKFPRYSEVGDENENRKKGTEAESQVAGESFRIRESRLEKKKKEKNQKKS